MTLRMLSVNTECFISLILGVVSENSNDLSRHHLPNA